MRHRLAGRTFNRDTNARKALFIGLAKNLIEKEQIKTTLPKAKDLRSVVEKMITRAKVDSVANRRLIASELGNGSDATVKKLELPDSVISIGDYAFGQAYAYNDILTNRIDTIILGENLQEIGNVAFSRNTATTIILPESLFADGRELNPYAFE